MLLCRQCSGGSTEGSFLCGHIIIYLYLTTVDVLFPNWTPFITYSCAPFFFYFLWNLFFCFHKLILFEVPFQFFVLDSQCRTKWHMVNKYFRSSSIFLLKINQYDKAEHYLKVAPISRLPLLYTQNVYIKNTHASQKFSTIQWMVLLPSCSLMSINCYTLI